MVLGRSVVLRFFAFLHGYRAFDHLVKDFLNNYMDAASKAFDYEAANAIFGENVRGTGPHLPERNHAPLAVRARHH